MKMHLNLGTHDLDRSIAFITERPGLEATTCCR
jgi:hypothetical protein